MNNFKQLRIQIKALDEKIKPFDDLVEERAVSHKEEAGVFNNAMAVWSTHEVYLDCNELESYRTLNYERFLLSQELETIYYSDMLENRKERVKIRRTLRKSGVKVPSELMTCELRDLV